MKNLLPRYLRQIEKYLPLKDRKDTIKELESIILDQADERMRNGETEENALYNVILEMGEPREVAVQYRNDQAMISREIEPLLMLILKIVSITLPLALMFAYTMDFVFASESIDGWEFLLNMLYKIPSILYTLIMAYGFIFLVFFLIGRYVTPKFTIEEKQFNPNLLPHVPTKRFETSLFESIFAICAGILFLYLINFQEGLIAIYYDGTREPLLNDNFTKILPLFNMSIAIDIVIHIYYSYKRRKNIASKTVELVGGIFSGIVMILLATGNIFNEVIIEGHNLNFLPNIVKIVFIIIGISTIIGHIVEYIKAFINIEEAIVEIDKIEKQQKLIKKNKS